MVFFGWLASVLNYQPWKVTIPGFLLRGRIVWGWILEIQWSLSSWNKLGSQQRQLQDHFMKLAKSPIFCITEIPVRGLDINTNSIKRQATFCVSDEGTGFRNW